MSNSEMGRGSKVAVTVILIIGFFVVGIFLQAAGAGGAFVGLLALGLFYGIRAMFKSGKKEETNALTLNKSDETSKAVPVQHE